MRCSGCGAQYSDSDIRVMLGNAPSAARGVACLICGKPLFAGTQFAQERQKQFSVDDVLESVFTDSKFQDFPAAQSQGYLTALRKGWIEGNKVTVCPDAKSGRLCSFQGQEYCRLISDTVKALGWDWNTVSDEDVMKLCRRTQDEHPGYCFFVTEDIPADRPRR